MAHFLALNNIIPPDEWVIKYEEGIDYIKRSNTTLFVIPYIYLLLIDNLKTCKTETIISLKDINIYKNKYEKELLEHEHDDDYVIIPTCEIWELINF